LGEFESVVSTCRLSAGKDDGNGEHAVVERLGAALVGTAILPDPTNGAPG